MVTIGRQGVKNALEAILGHKEFYVQEYNLKSWPDIENYKDKRAKERVRDWRKKREL